MEQVQIPLIRQLLLKIPIQMPHMSIQVAGLPTADFLEKYILQQLKLHPLMQNMKVRITL